MRQEDRELSGVSVPDKMISDKADQPESLFSGISAFQPVTVLFHDFSDPLIAQVFSLQSQALMIQTQEK